MKPIFPILLSSALFLFSGCFGGDDSSTEAPSGEVKTDTVSFSYENVSIMKPVEWDMVRREDRPDDIPSGVLFLISAVEPWGAGEAFATVAVAKESYPAGTSSRKYLEAAAQKTEREVIGYQELGKETMEVQGNPAMLLHFTGRNGPEDEVLEWQHLFVIRKDTGYVISSTAPPDASEEQKTLLRQIVLSFGFTEGTAL